jgi:hypothetical protein
MASFPAVVTKVVIDVGFIDSPSGSTITLIDFGAVSPGNNTDTVFVYAKNRSNQPTDLVGATIVVTSQPEAANLILYMLGNETPLQIGETRELILWLKMPVGYIAETTNFKVAFNYQWPVVI